MKKQIHFAPISLKFVIQRSIMGCVFILVEWYMFKFFIIPFITSNFFPHFFLIYFLIALWIIISLIWLYSYFPVCWFDAGSVKSEMKDLKQNNPNVKFDVYFHCQKCNEIKPFRTHHCSKCNTCYIRFDHHCPLTGNCVAFKNAQPFTCFLIYGDAMFFFISLFSFLSKYFYSTLVSSTAIAIGLIVSILFFILLIFATITFKDLINERTAYERNYQKNQSITSKNIFFRKTWFLPHYSDLNGLIWEGVVIFP